MFSTIPETIMQRVRWLLTLGWLLLIFSLFYDPVSPWLTHPDRDWSPLRLNSEVCIQVQGVCLSEQPYALGAPVFWGIIVPAAIFILLVFGHELWRRICPLSFLSQLPIAFKWQRQKKRVDSKTGQARYEIVRIKKDSWLGKNHLYFQFAWLYLGLCSRILFINSDRLALAAWLIFTILSAITVGYLYGGKSWCQYFCPMAPVQKIYAEPGGLFTSPAHLDSQPITQSMCRTTNQDGKEQSACVACKTPCIDIDSERSYWDGIEQGNQRFLYYSYFGLVLGYFFYYYLYAGNWTYYFSGAWAHQENQLQTLLSPGFYLFNTSIPIPKLVAVPFTLALFSFLGYRCGRFIEKRYKAYLKKHNSSFNQQQIQHRLFTLCTYLVFNIFFIFGGRPFVILLPISVQFIYETLLVTLSTLWLYKTWVRSPDLYTRESLASRLRKQLSKLQLDLTKFLEGRSLNDLNIDEVYILAKVLPGFTKDKRGEVYKGVLREALEEGYVDTASSLEVLQQIRLELNLSDEEHRVILVELGVEDPRLLDPNHLRSRENSVRLNGYRKSLERILALRQSEKNTFVNLLQENQKAVQLLKREYCITSQEEAEILAGFNPEAGVVRRAEFLLTQLRDLIDRFRALNQPLFLTQKEVLTLLRTTIQQKKRLLVRGLLEILERLGEEPEAMHIAHSLGNLAPTVLPDVLENPTSEWHTRLPSTIISLLDRPRETPLACPLDLNPQEIAYHLDTLLRETNPLLEAISLYLLYQVDSERSIELARQYAETSQNIVLQATAATILQQPEPTLAAFFALEKLVYMFNSDFFAGVSSETLIDLAERASIKVYQALEVVTEEGDTCRELLLLIEGEAEIQLPQEGAEVLIKHLIPGQILDELEVLSHAEQSGTIVAQATPTRILAIPVDTFDDILNRDRDFARRILEMESRRLQQLLEESQSLKRG